MGKQSARLYFGGRDHADAAAVDGDGYPHNHSMAYKDGSLLWKREKPKYIFLCGVQPGTSICTTERLDTLSAFADAPANMSYVRMKADSRDFYCTFQDISYAFGDYFAVIWEWREKAGGYENAAQWLCRSEDGYTWKKIKEYGGEDTLYGIKGYLYGGRETLAAIQGKSVSILNEGLAAEYIHDLPAEYASLFDRRPVIRTKEGVMVLQYDFLVITVNGSRFSRHLLDSLSRITDPSADGYFYQVKYGSSGSAGGIDLLAFRSADGKGWELFKAVAGFNRTVYSLAGGQPDESTAAYAVMGSSLYIFMGVEGQPWTRAVTRVSGSGTEVRKVNIDGFLCCVADGWFIFEGNGRLFKCRDDFGSQEDVRVNCDFGHSMMFRPLTAACADRDAWVSTP